MGSEKKKKYLLPFIANRGEMVFFPFQKTTISIGRDISKKAIESSQKEFDGQIIIGFLVNPDAEIPTKKDVFPICVLATIDNVSIQDNGVFLVDFSITERQKVNDISLLETMYLVCDSNALSDRDIPWSTQYSSFVESIKEKVNRVDFEEEKPDLISAINPEGMSPSEYCYRLAPSIGMGKNNAKKILSTDSVIERMQTILDSLENQPVSKRTTFENSSTPTGTYRVSSTWEKIESFGDLVLILGVGLGILILIASIIVALPIGDFLIFFGGIVFAFLIGISAFISSILIRGYSKIVRNNEEQIEERQIKKK